MSEPTENQLEKATKEALEMAARLDAALRPILQHEFDTIMSMLEESQGWKDAGQLGPFTHLLQESMIVDAVHGFMPIMAQASTMLVASIGAKHVLDTCCVRCPKLKEPCEPRASFEEQAAMTLKDMATESPDISRSDVPAGVMVARSPEEAIELIMKLAGATKEEKKGKDKDKTPPFIA